MRRAPSSFFLAVLAAFGLVGRFLARLVHLDITEIIFGIIIEDRGSDFNAPVVESIQKKEENRGIKHVADDQGREPGNISGHANGRSPGQGKESQPTDNTDNAAKTFVHKKCQS